MNTIPLKLEKIYELAYEALTKHGCDHLNADCVATTVTHAERDGSVSHGLFRIPGYVASLKSKKVNAVSRPTSNYLTQNAIRVDGDYGFAPVGIKVGLPELIKTSNKHGVGVLTITNTHHFAALWHETEALAENNLIGIACTAYKPSERQLVQKNHYLELIQFHLHGQEKIILLSFMTWQLLQWPWVRFRLQLEMVTKYHLEQD